MLPLPQPLPGGWHLDDGECDLQAHLASIKTQCICGTYFESYVDTMIDDNFVLVSPYIFEHVKHDEGCFIPNKSIKKYQRQ